MKVYETVKFLIFDLLTPNVLTESVDGSGTANDGTEGVHEGVNDLDPNTSDWF